jgi:hypothetical protein
VQLRNLDSDDHSLRFRDSLTDLCLFRAREWRSLGAASATATKAFCSGARHQLMNLLGRDSSLFRLRGASVSTTPTVVAHESPTICFFDCAAALFHAFCIDRTCCILIFEVPFPPVSLLYPIAGGTFPRCFPAVALSIPANWVWAFL